MTDFSSFGTTRLVIGIIVFLTSLNPALLEETYDPSGSSSLNCTTTDNYVNLNPTKASRLEEPKAPQYYQSLPEDQQQRIGDSQYHDNYNIRQSHRYLDEPNSDKYADDISRRLEEDISNRDRDVRPYNKYKDDKYNDDYETRRRFYDEQSRRDFHDEDDTINLKVQPLSRNFEDQQHPAVNTDKNLEVYPLNKNQDQPPPNYPDDRSTNRHGNDKYSDRYADDYELNRYANKQHMDNHENDGNVDEHHQVRPIDEHRSDYHTNRDSKINANEHQPSRHLDESNFHQNFDDHSDRYPQISNRNLEDQHTGRIISDDYDRRSIDRKFDRRTEDQQPNKHYDGQTNSNVNTQSINSKINGQRVNVDDRDKDLHTDDHYPNKHLDKLYPDRRLSNQNFERHLINQHPDERLGFQDPLIDKQPDDRERSISQSDRRLNARRLDNERFDDHDKRINDPNSKIHPDDPIIPVDVPSIDKHDDMKKIENQLTDDIRPDRRLSDDDYISHVTFKQSTIEHDEESEHSNVTIAKLYPESRFDDRIPDDISTNQRKEYNVSRLETFIMTKDWEESRPKLNFPKKSGHERYQMATLHLDKGIFVFDFLRPVLSVLLPRDIPIDLLKDTLEGKVNVSTLISKSIQLELVLIVVVIVLILLMFVIPSTECYLCCKPHRYKYKRVHDGSSVCFLCIFAIVMGASVIIMLVTNEQVAMGIERIPDTIEAALQDLRDYSSGTANELRRCMTRSLDVASEAILTDLDDVEELLGKPVQQQLSQETGIDVALESLIDVSNASQELAYKTNDLLKRAERAKEFGNELSREADNMRRELERTTRDCGPEDRSLCAVLDPSGLHLALRLERLIRDDRLLRLRSTSRDNLTEVGRQARGEYLYVPHHVARTTLETRNRIRREINTARGKVNDEARSLDASGSDLTYQLDKVRRAKDQIIPYVDQFEYFRWIIGFSTAMCLLFLWLLLFAALLCRCGCCENRVRPTLLWFACLSCLTSIAFWLVLIATLAIASHAEMLLCRPLDDPEYRTVEAVLETTLFLGRRTSVSFKDLFEKCEQHGSVYPAYQLDSTMKLEQLTAHWTWMGLKRAFDKLKVDLTGLRILSPNLRERLQNMLYATGTNLTEHRVMIQGPILNKDLNALSDQIENVARQLSDRRTARSLQTLAVQMRDLLSRRVKPLMKMQDELVYQLAALELHLQPLQSKVNSTLAQLRSVQYHIDNQGDKIGQLKSKAYTDRLTGYLDQWRTHVLTEVSSEVSKCRPLWDVLRGIKLLFCNHILGPLNGYWFSLFLCVITLLICTPTAHNLASSYTTMPSSRGAVLLDSPDTVVLERDSWQTPRPIRSIDSW